MDQMDNVWKFLNNDYVIAMMVIFVTAYGAMAQTKLPDFVVKLFKNDVFRIVFLSLLLMYRFEKAPHVALVVALVFVITLDYIGRQEAHENYVNVQRYLKY